MTTRWLTLEASFPDILLPVPLHRRALQTREYNQAELLARELSRQWHVAVYPEGLRRVRRTKPQYRLNRPDREKNVAGAFELGFPSIWFKNRNVLLIDDVATTGATLRECWKILKKAGAKRVEAFVLARDLAPASVDNPD